MVEIRGINLFEQPMNVYHVESLPQVYAEQVGMESRLLFVEASGDVSRQREGVVALKAVLGGRGGQGRFHEAEVQTLENLNFRT